MRIIKLTVLTVVLSVAGFFLFVFYVEPLRWPNQQKREAVRNLAAAKTQEELKSAVSYLGAFITPTNGGWLAIRYRDTHAFRVQSMAVARDSEGRWFECQRHFCGMLSHAARDIANEIRMRSEMPELFTNQAPSVAASRVPTMEELIPLFCATNLDAARKQLLLMGFREFNPR